MESLLFNAIFTFLITEVVVLSLMILPLPKAVRGMVSKCSSRVIQNKTFLILVCVLVGGCFVEAIRQMYFVEESVDALSETEREVAKQNLSVKS